MKDITDAEVQIRKAQFTDVYTVDSEIGRGKFAVVKRCVHRATGLDYAAKFVHKRRKGKDCRQAALREVQMLELTRAHPHIVELVEVYETNHELIIVTEYARGGELFSLIEMDGQLEEGCVVRLMHQILQGLAFLHHQSILHMDIKPQNILLTRQLPEGDVKLCDLGLARAFNSGEDILEIIGTPDYVAPEVLDYEPLGPACDMWSIGVLAYVMLTGCSPFAGDTKQETFLNISQVNLDFPPELFGSVSQRAIDFIRRLLVCDPRERLTAKECLEHAWFCDTSPVLPLHPDLAPSAPCPLTTGAGVGSPSGHRRSLPHSPTVNDEPTKKLKYNGANGELGIPAKENTENLGNFAGDIDGVIDRGIGIEKSDCMDTVSTLNDSIAPVTIEGKENTNHSEMKNNNVTPTTSAASEFSTASIGGVTTEEGVSRVVRRRPTIPKKPVAFCRPATNGAGFGSVKAPEPVAKPLRCSGSDQIDVVETTKIMV